MAGLGNVPFSSLSSSSCLCVHSCLCQVLTMEVVEDCFSSLADFGFGFRDLDH